MFYLVNIKELLRSKKLSKKFNTFFLEHKEKEIRSVIVNCSLPNAKNGGISEKEVYTHKGKLTIIGTEDHVRPGREIKAVFNSFGNLESLEIGEGDNPKHNSVEEALDYYHNLKLKYILIKSSNENEDSNVKSIFKNILTNRK